MSTYFDRLPVELLHMIFQFMSNCDIIWSFFNISPYLNAVLDDYSWKKLNFRSMSKCHFDYICNHLNIEIIHTLILSDNFNTPGQIQLFFNRFKLRDFINLHSLTLLSITNDDIQSILSDLPKLNYLNSLFTSCRSSKPLFIGQILNQLKTLENLSISYGDIFDHNVTFPVHTLKVLDAGICNFLELRRLQIMVPSLVSLKIILHANHQLQLLADSDIWLSMQRLDLTLNSESMVMFNEIQQFLLHFKNLKDLTLHIHGLADYLADGKLWETCPIIINLENFRFIIDFKYPFAEPNRGIDQIFTSFSTPFWIDIKKWYIAITTHRVYTISCFDNEIFHSPNSIPLSTSPNSRWFYSKTKRLKIDKNLQLINLHQFHHLEKLDLLTENILSLINNLHQYSYLHHLIFHQSISNQILGNILKSNPQINQLTLKQHDFNELSPLDTIHYLNFHDSILITNRIKIKQLSRVFPSIKQLSIYLGSIRLICQIIDSFHHLENGIFHSVELLKLISDEWLKENSQRLNNSHSFTSRTEPNQFLLWINNSAISKDKISEYVNPPIQKQRFDKCSMQ